MVTWTAELERDLFLAIVQVCEVKSMPWEMIAEQMQRVGRDVTKEGCRQHFNKVRRTANANTGGPNTPGTSRTKRTAHASGTSSKARGGDIAHAIDEAIDDEEEFEDAHEAQQTPSKRAGGPRGKTPAAAASAAGATAGSGGRGRGGRGGARRGAAAGRGRGSGSTKGLAVQSPIAVEVNSGEEEPAFESLAAAAPLKLEISESKAGVEGQTSAHIKLEIEGSTVRPVSVDRDEVSDEGLYD